MQLQRGFDLNNQITCRKDQEDACVYVYQQQMIHDQMCHFVLMCSSAHHTGSAASCLELSDLSWNHTHLFSWAASHWSELPETHAWNLRLDCIILLADYLLPHWLCFGLCCSLLKRIDPLLVDHLQNFQTQLCDFPFLYTWFHIIASLQTSQDEERTT